jgi:hypothetical protein
MRTSDALHFRPHKYKMMSRYEENYIVIAEKGNRTASPIDGLKTATGKSFLFL